MTAVPGLAVLPTLAAALLLPLGAWTERHRSAGGAAGRIARAG